MREVQYLHKYVNDKGRLGCYGGWTLVTWKIVANYKTSN